MLTYLRYLQARYLNEKGQGMVEYAVIVAIIVGIGIALNATTDGAFKKEIQDLYTDLIAKVPKN
jgi:pilus assembly protein Flp/PilA